MGEEEQANVELPEFEEGAAEGEGTLVEGGEPEGEEEPLKEDTATQAAQEPEPAPEPEEEDEKTKVQKRIDALVWEREETKRKLNLFKTMGPEKYYEAYPDERPADYRPPAKQDADVDDYESMIVRGGQYDGWTLGDLAREKPLTAQKMLNDYLDGQRQAQREVQEREVLAKRTWENEVNAFGESLCKEIYERPYTELTQEEIDKVNEVIFSVDQWKKANKKEAYSFADAYALMNSKTSLKTAKEKAAMQTVEALKKSPVASVSGKADRSKQSIDYGSLSEDGLGDLISGMSDLEAEKFYREAPQSLKDKYPSLPWE